MDTIALDPRLRHASAFLGRTAGRLIDGKLVQAVSGKTFPVYDPANATLIGNVSEADKADVDLAVAAARRAFDSGAWAKFGPSGRGRMLWKMADLIERDLEELAELESIDNGKPYSVARVADLPLAVDMFRYMAGWATKITGTTLPLSLPGEYLSYTLLLYAARAGGRRGADHSVELPAADGGLEAGAGPGGGLHGSAEGGGADADDRAAPGRAFPGGRLPAGRGQHPDRLRRNRRRGDRGPSGRGQGRLHRIDRGRQADRPGRFRQPEESVAGTGRQVAGGHPGRRRPGHRHSRRGERDFLQSQPGLLRRIAAVRAQIRL